MQYLPNPHQPRNVAAADKVDVGLIEEVDVEAHLVVDSEYRVVHFRYLLLMSGPL